ncbi:MAG TPA: fused MFS/spermidine synthase [Candidatus Hydrogenedentes bacterium]|nr:fused MFS/spermidine synthase [Candidatus Hydrogenedentota bacterium]
MGNRVLRIGVLLFGSGTCALVYQIAWLRELRLVFGGSTAASGAVLAIFMGGLGLGSAVLGKRAERHPRPLAFYAQLEFLIAGTALLSPVLIVFVRKVYILLGGSLALGMPVATGVRIILSALVLGIPTFLMGGTLPAAGRAGEAEEDAQRSHLALLYGLNTLGAVCGAALSNFHMLETLGTRRTLWLACVLNVWVAITARRAAGQLPDEEVRVGRTGPGQPAVIGQTETFSSGNLLPAAPVLIASFIVGFAFFLMELVWFRMLAPLLGGTTYTFGLILSVALFGIGVGGAFYSLASQRMQATVSAFALSVGLEAGCIAVPYALGDRIGVLSDVVRGLGAMGFGGHVAGWCLVAGLVVLPAAVVSGFQFPLLIALLGKGKRHVAEQTGLAYAWNTAGAIVGSLAGGFGLLPLLTAPGTWRAVVFLLALVGGVAVALSARVERRRFRLFLSVGVIVAAVLLAILPAGPTAAWRHSGIGASRSTLDYERRNTLRDSLHRYRRNVVWEAEGVESSVALLASDGYAFSVNGKVDGNAIGDASTQVMLGLLSALLHPEPAKSMVIGLGTGSSAGWLAQVPAMECVDVVELEPAVVEVARRCAPVNANVLDNPKVNVIIGDGREILLTAPDQYDLIVSEPSNPYRAGIASLYTREFYEGVAARLAPGGIFTQWLQAYEIDTRTVQTIYATLVSVFPYVETWQSNPQDLLLLCSESPVAYPIPDLRRRVQSEPFRSALLWTWRAIDLEGVLARFIGNARFAELAGRRRAARLNTDDRTLIEFGFARTLGQKGLFSTTDLFGSAETLGLNRPAVEGGAIDWASVDEQRFHMFAAEGQSLSAPEECTEEQAHRVSALSHFADGRLTDAAEAWHRQPRTPAYPVELVMVAEAVAETGDDQAETLIEQLRAYLPMDADAVQGRLHWRRGEAEAAVGALERAFMQHRADPWASSGVMKRALEVAQEIALADSALARRLADALSAPFVVYAMENQRRQAALDVALRVDREYAGPFVEVFEPHVPWNHAFLWNRYDCYMALDHPLYALAKRQLIEFLRHKPAKFEIPAEAAEGVGAERSGDATSKDATTAEDPSTSGAGVEPTQE